MTFSEAKAALAPKITPELGAAYCDLPTDGMLWVEHNIFPLADISLSITSVAGELLAEWCEEELVAMHSNTFDV